MLIFCSFELSNWRYNTNGKASDFGRGSASVRQYISKNGIQALCHRTEVKYGYNEPGDPRDYRNINTTRILDKNGNEFEF